MPLLTPSQKKAIINQVVFLRLFFCLQRNRDVIQVFGNMESVISHFLGDTGEAIGLGRVSPSSSPILAQFHT